MPDDALLQRLNAAIDVLDDSQRQRLLDWAGGISRKIENAREPGTSIGPLAEMMHITNLGSGGGRATYRMDVVPELLNPHGVLHGGAVYTMVDYSMGGATMAALPDGEVCATIEIKINYLASVRSGSLTCGTEIVKKGRKVVFLESRVTDNAGKLVATASGSFAVIRPGE